MRRWIKEIFREVIKEEIKDNPLITSARAPCEDDLYVKGTTWLHGNDRYVAREVKVKWEKL